jgi:UDP-glucose 6-dehydrogenase
MFASENETFKPNTDDMRDAPSLDIVPALQAMGATIQPSIRGIGRQESSLKA